MTDAWSETLASGARCFFTASFQLEWVNRCVKWIGLTSARLFPGHIIIVMSLDSLARHGEPLNRYESQG